MNNIRLIALAFLLTCSVTHLFAQTDMTEFPITEYKADNESSVQIFYLSGDGGMNEFSKTLCSRFAKQGYSVIALDSKKYFWSKKSPEIFVKDLSAIIRHFQDVWKGNSFILLGYSFGADVGAFIPGRLSEDLMKRMKYSVFLNPSYTTDFEVKLADMLGKNSENGKYNALDEINSLGHFPVMCLISEDELGALSGKIHDEEIKIKTLPGDHRFNRDVDLIISTIITLI